VGKTSLLATFATLRRPYTGTLKILGHPTENSRNLRAIRARLGYLPANFRWAANLSVRDFVGYVAYYKSTPQAAVTAMLARMELEDVATMELGVLPPELRLRAGLAATCVHEPDLVLLDEPCGELEEPAWADLMPLIRSLAPTVVLTAPAAHQLTGWCDQVLSLVRGRLIGLPPDLAGPAAPVGSVGSVGSVGPIGSVGSVGSVGPIGSAGPIGLPHSLYCAGRVPVGSGARG
jgi:ABC-type multidrug transport system ATPase subunit